MDEPLLRSRIPETLSVRIRRGAGDVPGGTASLAEQDRSR